MSFRLVIVTGGKRDSQCLWVGRYWGLLYLIYAPSIGASKEEMRTLAREEKMAVEPWDWHSWMPQSIILSELRIDMHITNPHANIPQ